MEFCRHMRTESHQRRDNMWVDDNVFLQDIVHRYDTWHRSLLSLSNNAALNSSNSSSQNAIPKILHFIWLGSPLPAKFHRIIDHWRDIHPTWRICMWTDTEVADMTLENQEAFLKAGNFGKKSDILRYEILLRMGGVYVDVDYECLLPIDTLCDTSSFFAGLANTRALEVNNGLIACTPGHPLMRKLVSMVTLNSTTASNDNVTDCTVITASLGGKIESVAQKGNQMDSMALLAALGRGGFLNQTELGTVGSVLKEKKKEDPMKTISETGPGVLTRCIFEYFRDDAPSALNAPTKSMDSLNSLNLLDSLRSSDEASQQASSPSQGNHLLPCVVFPISFFSPVPNNVRVNLEDELALNNLKSVHVNAGNSLDRLFTSDASMTRQSLHPSPSFAVHWWQRSWQSSS